VTRPASGTTHSRTRQGREAFFFACSVPPPAQDLPWRAGGWRDKQLPDGTVIHRCSWCPTCCDNGPESVGLRPQAVRSSTSARRGHAVDTNGGKNPSCSGITRYVSPQLNGGFRLPTSNATVVLQIVVGHGHWDLLHRAIATITTGRGDATSENQGE
jgi:hypothetical protein